MKYYRIVPDYFQGYEVQIWRWYWPFWVQPIINTSCTIEEATVWAKHHAESVAVVYLGKL